MKIPIDFSVQVQQFAIRQLITVRVRRVPTLSNLGKATMSEEQKTIEIEICYGGDEGEAKFEECKAALEQKYGDKITVTGSNCEESSDDKFEIKCNGEVIHEEGAPSEEQMEEIYSKIDAASGGGSGGSAAASGEGSAAGSGGAGEGGSGTGMEDQE